MSFDEQDPNVAAIAELRAEVAELRRWHGVALGLILARACGIPTQQPSAELFEKLGMKAQSIVPASGVVVGS